MKRSALQTFFARSLFACLPLGLGAPPTPTCGTHQLIVPDGGVPQVPISAADCNHLCGGVTCDVVVTDAGTPAIDCFTGYCASRCGRLTDGVVAPRRPDGDEVGAHFAEMAALEAASVHSFRRLARELRAHGAPAGLIARSYQAARDEVRHTRIAERLAQSFGGRRLKADAPSLPTRALEAVAIENAVEGCVRETFGALVASWQAATAGNSQVRRALRSIAADERGHADLSWEVAAWAQSRLEGAACARIREARREAVDALALELAVEPPAHLVRLIGLPTGTAAHALHDEAKRALWS